MNTMSASITKGFGVSIDVCQLVTTAYMLTLTHHDSARNLLVGEVVDPSSTEDAPCTTADRFGAPLS